MTSKQPIPSYEPKHMMRVLKILTDINCKFSKENNPSIDGQSGLCEFGHIEYGWTIGIRDSSSFSGTQDIIR